MKYNFTQPVLDIRGTEVRDGGKILSFADVIVTALLTPTHAQQTGQEKVRAYELAQKITNATGQVEITLDELELVKGATERSTPLVCGQVLKYLESAKAEE